MGHGRVEREGDDLGAAVGPGGGGKGAADLAGERALLPLRPEAVEERLYLGGHGAEVAGSAEQDGVGPLGVVLLRGGVEGVLAVGILGPALGVGHGVAGDDLAGATEAHVGAGVAGALGGGDGEALGAAGAGVEHDEQAGWIGHGRSGPRGAAASLRRYGRGRGWEGADVGQGLPGQAGGAPASRWRGLMPWRDGGDLAGDAGVVGCEAVSNRGKCIMGDTKKPGIDRLPGNHGQFGADVETENYEALPDLEVPDRDVPGPQEPGAASKEGVPGGEALVPAPDEVGGVAGTPGQHQEQGGMRS